MLEHRNTLEPYNGMNTRYHCPYCNHSAKTFVRYIDNETGEHIHPTVGRCNRQNNCGHHYTPKQYFMDNNIVLDTTQFIQFKPKSFATQPKPISYIPDEVFHASVNHVAVKRNCFVYYLNELFGENIASELVVKYNITTSKYWKDATVFWQKDVKGKIRTGKIMLYDSSTGKRVREPMDHIHWVHKLRVQPEFVLGQCLFGEHLLIDESKPVAIVEAEKTAIISSVYYPEFIWVSTGCEDGLTSSKCSVLKDRRGVLFPDLSKPKTNKPTAFEIWSKKAKELQSLANFQVSDLLERNATESERAEGFDLADYLIKYKHEKVRAQRVEPITPPPSADDLIFQAMAKENPHLLDFVNVLDLVNPSTGQPYLSEN
jgi:hypothetical protein